MAVENTLPVFGGNDRVVRPDDFIRILADVFDTPLYGLVRLSESPVQIHRAYQDNQTFWKDAIAGHLFESMRISLQKFHLLEWIPSAPGRYFTNEAESSRKDAQAFLVNAMPETYLPLGKLGMILGGVGSLRLAAKNINSQFVYFLGASSNGVSHQGVPVALPESEYRKVIQIIKETGGCLANIVGRLDILQLNLARVQYDRRIPKYYLFVEEVTPIRPSFEDETLTTVAITFPSSHDSRIPQDVLSLKDGIVTSIQKSWSYCSFKGPSQKGLYSAVDWLSHYAIKYSKMSSPAILSDFDEQNQHFNNPIEFPISQISLGNFDADILSAYQNRYKFVILNIEELNMAVFDQRGQHVNYQYNAAGDINFGAVQNRQELVGQLEKFKAELAKAGDAQVIDAELVTDVEYQITKAVQEAKKPEPKKETILERVNGAKALIEGVTAAGGMVTALVKAAELVHKFF